MDEASTIPRIKPFPLIGNRVNAYDANEANNTDSSVVATATTKLLTTYRTKGRCVKAATYDSNDGSFVNQAKEENISPAGLIEVKNTQKNGNMTINTNKIKRR